MDEKNDHKTDKTPEELVGHRLRMRFDWNNLIEDLIEDGKNQGMFDNLRGKGKPLKLDSNLYAPEKVLANKLLKDNDLTPAWIMNRNRILEQKEQLRAEMQKKWTQHQQAHRFAQGQAQIQALVISWDDACRAWEAEIVKLNKQIDDFNLKRPIDNMELFKLRFEEELKKIDARRYL
ncbi:MAG: DnaJ family domain-containing protein [Chloroflexota bacterium]